MEFVSKNEANLSWGTPELRNGILSYYIVTLMKGNNERVVTMKNTSMPHFHFGDLITYTNYTVSVSNIIYHIEINLLISFI